jgi:hypothetical protein
MVNTFVLDPRRKFGLDGGKWHCFGKNMEERTDADFMVDTPRYADKTFDFNQVNAQNLHIVQNGNYQTTPLNERPLPQHWQNHQPQLHNLVNLTRQGVPPPSQHFDDNGPTHVSLNTLQHQYMDKLGLTSPMDINIGRTFNLNTIEENQHSLTPIQHGSRQAFQKQASIMSQGNGDFDRPELHTFGRGNRPDHASKTRAAQINNKRNRLNSKSHTPVSKNRIPALPE